VLNLPQSESKNERLLLTTLKEATMAEVSEIQIEEESSESTDPEGPTVHEEITAETVNIQQGGAQTVKAEKVYVEQGGIGRAEAKFVDVKDGGIGIAQGENVTLTDGGVVVVAAENVKMEDAMAVFVAANQIEGEGVKVLVDMRAAVIFALVLGAVTSLFKLITKRSS
jgi:hypothetical protein